MLWPGCFSGRRDQNCDAIATHWGPRMSTPEPEAFDTKTVIHAGGAAVVECRGELDLATKDEMESLLRRLLYEFELVVVDVSQAQFIDSSFIHNLFMADSLARDQGRPFRVQYQDTPLETVLRISGVLDQLDCGTTRLEVLR